ncbi:MAG TPA: hypothetical protein VFW15_14465 [Thermoanaerobaculia bacterium]|nr:hypothetical protein [Thermoanaerobaculia bacterium]
MSAVGGISIALAAGGFLLAAWTFWKNTRIRRAEWLFQLYEAFSVRPELKPTRAALDYEGEPNRELFRCLDSDPENSKVLEPLVDYLNFFEFIAVLWRMGQLSVRETKLMFGYYLKGIGESKRLVQFCEKGGFRNLLSLLRKIGYAPTHA